MRQAKGTHRVCKIIANVNIYTCKTTQENKSQIHRNIYLSIKFPANLDPTFAKYFINMQAPVNF